MKYKIETDDKTEHLHSVHGLDWALVVWEIDQQLRSKLKYGHEFKTVDEALEKIRTYLHTYIEEKGVSLEMLT